MEPSDIDDSAAASSRTGRARRHRRNVAANGHEHAEETLESSKSSLRREIVELQAQKEALQLEVDAMGRDHSKAHASREKGSVTVSENLGFPQLFNFISHLNVEERANIACRILEQVISEMSQAEAQCHTQGWHGKTMENVKAIRKSLLMQMAGVANLEATDVIHSKATPQTPKTASFVTSLQDQLSEAVAQQAHRDPEWMKADGHFSSAVADVLDLRPFTEAALEMLEEIGIDDANKIRLQDLLRAEHSDAHKTEVARKVALQVCERKGLVLAHTEEKDARGDTPLLAAALRGSRGELWLLLQAGADPRKRRKEGGQAATHIVCANNCVDCLLVLADKGADLDQGDHRGRSAAHTACAHKAVEALRALAARGANLNHQDEEGRTPAHVCSANNDAECLAVLAEARADLSLADEASETPAHLAAELNTVDALKALIRHGVKVDQHAKGEGDAAVHIAAYRGNLEALQALIEGGASLLLTNKKGNTPLHSAAYYGHAKAVQMLIDAKASPCAVNKKGWTPLDLADSQAKDDCVALLRKYEGWTPPAKALPPPPPPKAKAKAEAAPMQKPEDSAGSARQAASPSPRKESRDRSQDATGRGGSAEEEEGEREHEGGGGRAEARERRERRREAREARRAARASSPEP